ncbi:MAG: hypothetical protein E6J85_21175 [Deltaproteobacteria bacterium]|nr:MAG: hypothetical protein E6J85_21175 [Deltaproteobacteria bacterium]
MDPQTTQAPPQAPFAVALPQFEGPLDLLLSLIQEHKLDIFDVPIAFLTARYLEYLEHAREVDLDLAGEYLVMAATLAHIKSRMLLPREEAGDAEGAEVGPDPREELIRRLLEYQKYKRAAQDLAALPQLGRDVFAAALPGGGALPPVARGERLPAHRVARRGAPPPQDRDPARGVRRAPFHRRSHLRHRRPAPRRGAHRLHQPLRRSRGRRSPPGGPDLPRAPRDGEAQARPHPPGGSARRDLSLANGGAPCRERRRRSVA